MFDFGNANEGQRKAISSAEGPVLITAGPGTGKTYTLVQRAIYLIPDIINLYKIPFVVVAAYCDSVHTQFVAQHGENLGITHALCLFLNNAAIGRIN